MKVPLCNRCKNPKDYIIKSGKRAGKYHTYCRACLAKQVFDWTQRNRARAQKQQKAWWDAHPEAKLRAQMKRYGKDENWYAEQLAKQRGVCGVCRKPERRTNPGRRGRKGLRLSVDHQHNTGKVRGLLCNACNRSLASLENQGWLTAAYEYLKHYEGDGL
jgi:hypothetical protein